MFETQNQQCFLYHQSAYNTVGKQAAAFIADFLIALPAEHAAKFFQPFFLPGLAGALFLWYHALQKQKWPQAAGEPP